MAWIEIRKSKRGNHYWIYYRIDGNKMTPLDGSFHKDVADMALAKAEQLESQNRMEVARQRALRKL